MIFDYILLEHGIHWTTYVLFGLSLAFYLFNLQYFLKHLFKYTSTEALETKLNFQQAQVHFGPNTYIENNPVDRSKRNLEVYKKPETLDLQVGKVESSRP